MAEEFKAITITGGAAAELGLLPKKRGGRRTRKSGGADEGTIGAPPQLQQVITTIKKIGGAHELMPATTLVAPSLTSQQAVMQPQPQSQPVQQGGTNPIKVELKKKHLSKKVTLNPKKQDAADVKQPAQTKKARKFVLGISSMHKRVTRAKKIHHKLDKMPLEELRKQLIASKLIKPTSKAPEAILRQIAKDSQLVGKKIL
jgi:hypothetical protein